MPAVPPLMLLCPRPGGDGGAGGGGPAAAGGGHQSAHSIHGQARVPQGCIARCPRPVAAVASKATDCRSPRRVVAVPPATGTGSGGEAAPIGRPRGSHAPSDGGTQPEAQRVGTPDARSPCPLISISERTSTPARVAAPVCLQLELPLTYIYCVF